MKMCMHDVPLIAYVVRHVTVHDVWILENTEHIVMYPFHIQYLVSMYEINLNGIWDFFYVNKSINHEALWSCHVLYMDLEMRMLLSYKRNKEKDK